MDPVKEKLLHDTYHLYLMTSTGTNLPLADLDAVIAPDMTGFGTTVDEKMHSLSEFHDLMDRQRKQSEALELSWCMKPFSRQIMTGGNGAVFAEDLFLEINAGNHTTEIYMRLTTVLEYRAARWMVVHWHGSKPEDVASETDTFGLEEWKERTVKLENLVAERTRELKQQKESLELALKELHATQAQLIQSEKMASLGELTAGIAHEIQNPLNFVNNFSDVSIELLDEMEEELNKGDANEAKAIAGDIKQNLEKIVHHGRRADRIVKGMLEHSRSSTGQKEPTDINMLADEYFRLAYHGIRAKDKSFNAELITNFDENLPKASIIPQDIGRVLLNLFTNAFYATQQKQLQVNDGSYKATVTVTTNQIGNSIEIDVKDNGTGIPDAIKDKILQPFFTTKPTGEGTGLGLSLSYDIVVKGHNGSINLESEEGKGATFKFFLPINI